MLRVTLRLAVRNVVTNRVNLAIGSAVLIATMVAVTGGSIVDSITRSAERGVVESLSGDIQLYSSRSKQPLELLNDGDEPELEPFDYAPVVAALSKLPEVKTTVPMGVGDTEVPPGNLLDRTLGDLRIALRKSAPARPDSFGATVAYLQRLTHRLHVQYLSARGAVGEGSDALATLARFDSPAFWEQLQKDPLPAVDLLDNQLAPLMGDGNEIDLRYLGTDFAKFKASFPRFRLVRGQEVPPGKPGLLLSDSYAEDKLKIDLAHKLDEIRKDHEVDHRPLTDEEVAALVKELPSTLPEFADQLDDARAAQATERLRSFLGSKDGDLDALLRQYVQLDDQNVQKRYDFFYAQLAPLVSVYRIDVGGSVVLRAFGRAGYVQSIRVPVYGTFEFEGLKGADSVSTVNLLDLGSFQKLQGELSAATRREVEQMREGSHLDHLDRKTLEAAFFSGSAVASIDPVKVGFDDAALLAQDRQGAGEVADAAPVSPRVLNVAVVLKPGQDRDAALEKISQVVKPLELTAVDWAEASGSLGQVLNLAKVALWAAVFVLLMVGAAVINNTLMLVAVQRTQEIGTLRALGTQRSTISLMVILETVILVLVFGGIGSALGLVTVGILGHVGMTDFVFHGPALFPVAGVGNVVAAMVPVLVVALFATILPVRLAARVSPLRAMQTEAGQ